MAEEASTPVVAPPSEVAAPESALVRAEGSEVKDSAGANGTDVVASAPEPEKPVATETSAPVEAPQPDQVNDESLTPAKPAEDKPAATPQDIEMKDAAKEDEATPVSAPAPAASESADAAVDTPASSSKAKTPRRKSGGIPEHKGKKLNKKASKAKLTHLDAQPGDHFFVRLKGFPLWPAIICDDSMLPEPIIKSRPVTARQEDGTYRAGYEDGGVKAKDRTYPVMYLHTNEFGWIPNTDLLDLDPATVGDVQPKRSKPLAAAHVLAAEQHDLDYYKDILQQFQEARAADLAAKEAAKEAKAEAKKAEKAAKKATPKKKAPADVDGDLDMPDATGEPDDDQLDVAGTEKPKNGKKRKAAADEAETPQRADSVKKVKTIKLTTTPKINGTATPKSAKDSTAKSAKPKKQKATPKAAASPEEVIPKEPELSPEEKRLKKEAKILFLRHKLQKGLLTRDQDPKEEEMKQMSEFVTKLEGYADLEVSIIRATKINKVLKAILKLNTIPKEEEFQFKPRSTALLDKWNKLLASEQGTPVAATSTNGVGAEAKASADDAKTSSSEPTNGVKEAPEEAKVEPKVEEAAAAAESAVAGSKAEDKVEPKVEDAAPAVEEPVKEAIPEPAPVESAA
ncbi:PWWP domain-containing protein [Lachnellula suecica]|uniref:PWWP domain-containing protein n=1 Tax=Lachnellula suecica TaxID=602035 RepID=A0A8T9C7Z4_9HELO|nr:PWWP domain-containing protein [Lachnellula suecica]